MQGVEKFESFFQLQIIYQEGPNQSTSLQDCTCHGMIKTFVQLEDVLVVQLNHS